MITELYELIDGVKPIITSYIPASPYQEKWRKEWLAKANRLLAERVQTSPELQLLTEVWAQYRYATQRGYNAGGLSTLEDVQDYLTARGILDPEGNILGVDNLFEIDRLPRVNIPEPVPEPLEITDGFGHTWSKVCPKCKKSSMIVIRPGDARCSSCE